jgi:hypothetical protein
MGIEAVNVGNALVGIGATLLAKFMAVKTWTLINEDTSEVMQGQFPSDSNSREVGSNWAQIQSLNRSNAILQFLNGKNETLSVSSRFYRRDFADGSPDEKINKLITWAKRDATKGRPPILLFALGDGKSVNMRVILESLSGITYSTPNYFGGVREVKFTMNFTEFVPFSLSDKQVTDTRYHRAKDGEYYELIAWGEYGNALLGDVIRKHPYHTGKAVLQPGAIVRLPSIEGVRTTKITQKSPVLAGAYSPKATAQRTLRLDTFQRRSGPRNVFIFDQPRAVLQGSSTGIFDDSFDETFE